MSPCALGSRLDDLDQPWHEADVLPPPGNLSFATHSDYLPLNRPQVPCVSVVAISTAPSLTPGTAPISPFTVAATSNTPTLPPSSLLTTPRHNDNPLVAGGRRGGAFTCLGVGGGGGGVSPPATIAPLAPPTPPHGSLLTPGQGVGGMDRKRKKSTHSLDGMDSDEDEDAHSRGHQSSTSCDVSMRHSLSPITRQNHSEIEKRRRDKMNTYITELSALIPMCSAMNRKLDKLTVLRMAVQHINSLKGSSKVCSEISDKPSYMSDDELKRLILNVADGFLFVIGCDRGRILYVSESVRDVLQYSQSDLIGQSLFDILHPRDIGKVKEQLSSSDLTPREKLIDAKTMLPVKTEYPQKPTHLCSGARRSFFCHMKSAGKVTSDLANSVKVKKELMETTYPRKRKSERKNYKVIHCTGYLKSWSKAKIGLDEDSEADSDCSILSCLVAVGREQAPFNPYRPEPSPPQHPRVHPHIHPHTHAHAQLPPPQQTPSPPTSHIKVRSVEYMSRHNVDGKFTYVDERATVILGYLPQELLGTSIYEYYHQDDISSLGQVHRKVLSSKDKIETDVYRFKLKNGRFLHLKSRCFSFRNPWTKEVEYIVSTNTVVQIQEVSSSGQLFEPPVSVPEDVSDFQALDSVMEASASGKASCLGSIPGMVGGTLAGAGRIGKQIADECVEQINKIPAAPADSSNPGSQIRIKTPPSSSSPSSALFPPSSSTCSSSFATPARPAATNASSAVQLSNNLSNININNINSINNLSASVPAGSNHWLDMASMVCSDNGINNLHSRSQSEDSSTEGSLIQSVMQEQTMDSLQNPGNDINDEAALAFLMSLLEADAGLGGPVDFNDLPWPL